MDLILPNRSLMIVDKGWLKGKPSGWMGGGASQKKQHANGRKHKVDDIAITVMESPSGKGSDSKELPQAFDDDRKRNLIPRPAQTLRFVNATTPAHNRDPEVRKLVRSHVRKGSSRDEKSRRRPKKEPDAFAIMSNEVLKGPKSSNKHLFLSPKPSPSLSGSTIPLYGGSEFTVEPRFQRFIACYLDHIASVLYPRDSHLTFNPVREEWFPLAVTDEVMLYTTMLAAATHISIQSGFKATEEPDLLTERVLHQLNRRLTNGSKLTDPTLGAIACLALLENMQGHYDKWRIHMEGMANIVKLRGGISAVGLNLQIKLCRADIEGSVDTLSIPQLSPPPRLHQPVYSTIIPGGDPGPQNNILLAMLISSKVNSHLVSIYQDLSRFSYAMEFALNSTKVKLHPRSFDEDVIFTQYELLRSQDHDKSDLERALRLGAILYVKSVSRSVPLNPWSSTNLGERLKSVVSTLATDVQARLLLVWLCFIGGSASQQPNREWFVETLFKILALEAQPWTWDDAKDALRKVLWVEQIHGDECKRFWDEI